MFSQLIYSNYFEANRRLVVARWFYVPAIFLIGALLSYMGSSLPLPLMLGVCSAYVLANIFFKKSIAYAELHHDERLIRYISIGQIALELVCFVPLLYFSGGDRGVITTLFFIPIVSSMALFDIVGSLVVAFVCALCINAVLLFEYRDYIGYMLGYGGSVSVHTASELILRLMSTVTNTSAFFIVGALSSFIASMLRKRDYQISDEHKRKKMQADRLRALNNEYNTYARMLVRNHLGTPKATRDGVQLEKERSEFISTVAHQLRTPLSAIKWTLDLLLKGEAGTLSGEQRALIMKAHESNERIINLIKDMLGVDQIESGGADFSFAPTDLAALLRLVVKEFAPRIEERRIALHDDIDSAMPRAMVDPQKMRMVFQNLLENAIKYTGSDIWISTKRNDDSIVISVRDNGIGIPERDHSDVFKRFFRAENASTRDPEGSGLGLFIVRSVLQRHGGDVSFESKERSGTTFTCTIPLRH